MSVECTHTTLCQLWLPGRYNFVGVGRMIADENRRRGKHTTPHKKNVCTLGRDCVLFFLLMMTTTTTATMMMTAMISGCVCGCEVLASWTDCAASMQYTHRERYTKTQTLFPRCVCVFSVFVIFFVIAKRIQHVSRLWCGIICVDYGQAVGLAAKWSRTIFHNTLTDWRAADTLLLWWNTTKHTPSLLRDRHLNICALGSVCVSVSMSTANWLDTGDLTHARCCCSCVKALVSLLRTLPALPKYIRSHIFCTFKSNNSENVR